MFSNQDIRNNSYKFEKYVCEKYNLAYVDGDYDALDNEGNKIEIKSCIDYRLNQGRISPGRFLFKPVEMEYDLKYYFIVYDRNVNVVYEWSLDSEKLRKFFKFNNRPKQIYWTKVLAVI